MADEYNPIEGGFDSTRLPLSPEQNAARAETRGQALAVVMERTLTGVLTPAEGLEIADILGLRDPADPITAPTAPIVTAPAPEMRACVRAGCPETFEVRKTYKGQRYCSRECVNAVRRKESVVLDDVPETEE